MNRTIHSHGIPLARVFLSLVTVFVLSACATPPGAGTLMVAGSPSPSPTQAASPAIPDTGAAAPAAMSLPTATVASPTLTLAPQASPTASAQPAAALAATTQPTPAASACQGSAALTPAQTEGPYFKANSPERTTLIETGVTGTQLVLTGYVLMVDCKPVAGALLDFWQADGNGQYDNAAYRLRGHQFSDAQGRFQLITVIPGLYTGRTEHIHVKVQAPNGPVLTTQLYFPDVAANQRDSIFSPSLLVKLEPNGNPQHASFNFIVQAP